MLSSLPFHAFFHPYPARTPSIGIQTIRLSTSPLSQGAHLIVPLSDTSREMIYSSYLGRVASWKASCQSHHLLLTIRINNNVISGGDILTTQFITQSQAVVHRCKQVAIAESVQIPLLHIVPDMKNIGLPSRREVNSRCPEHRRKCEHPPRPSSS